MVLDFFQGSVSDVVYNGSFTNASGQDHVLCFVDVIIDNMSDLRKSEIFPHRQNYSFLSVVLSSYRSKLFRVLFVRIQLLLLFYLLGSFFFRLIFWSSYFLVWCAWSPGRFRCTWLSASWRIILCSYPACLCLEKKYNHRKDTSQKTCKRL